MIKNTFIIFRFTKTVNLLNQLIPKTIGKISNLAGIFSPISKRMNIIQLIIIFSCSLFQAQAKQISTAKLRNIKLKSIGKYRCDSHIKDAFIDSEQNMLCHDILIEFFIENGTLTSNCDHLTMHHINEHYFVNALNVFSQYKQIGITSETVNFNTKTETFVLSNYNGRYENIKFYSSNQLVIRDFNFSGTNIHVNENENTWIFIQNAQLTKNHHLIAQNIHSQTDGYNVNISVVNIKDIFRNPNGLIENIVLKNKSLTASCIAGHVIGKLHVLFHDPINIQTDKIKIQAAQGEYIDDKIHLKDISYSTKIKLPFKLSGKCPSGYLDLKEKKFVLEEGSITW